MIRYKHKQPLYKLDSVVHGSSGIISEPANELEMASHRVLPPWRPKLSRSQLLVADPFDRLRASARSTASPLDLTIQQEHIWM